jgi:uncharacterized protein (TIGR03437 family)
MFRIALFVVFLAPGSLNLYSQANIAGVVNSASFQSGLPAGGALATAFVSGLTALIPGTYVAPSSTPLPHYLGGVTVSVNDDYAPLLAVIVPTDPSANVQVNFQVPLSANTSLLYPYFGIAPVYVGYVRVSDGVNNAVLSATRGLPEWGGFFTDGNGYAAALHASDSSPVTAQNPAQPGETIVVYADDLFMTWPPPPIAIPAPQQVTFQIDYTFARTLGNLYLQVYPNPASMCAPNPGLCPGTGSVTGTPALTINSMGLAAGTVGVEEINFVIPLSQQPGTWPLFFNAGSCPDGSGIPGTCGATYGSSSPYVLLPVK